MSASVGWGECNEPQRNEGARLNYDEIVICRHILNQFQRNILAPMLGFAPHPNLRLLTDK